LAPLLPAWLAGFFLDAAEDFAEAGAGGALGTELFVKLAIGSDQGGRPVFFPLFFNSKCSVTVLASLDAFVRTSTVPCCTGAASFSSFLASVAEPRSRATLSEQLAGCWLQMAMIHSITTASISAFIAFLLR
jgi:hypothetical protein